MKKVFLSTMAMIDDPKSYIYETTELKIKAMDTPFPIITLMANHINNNDEVKIITIVAKNSAIKTNAESNYQQFCRDANVLLDRKNIKLEFIEISMSNVSKSDSHRLLFQDIVNNLEDDDEIYTDITYGFKSTPIVIFSALNFSYKTKQNVDVRNIIYGNLYNGTREIKPEIFDITSLFYINSLSGTLGNLAIYDKESMFDFLVNKSGR